MIKRAPLYNLATMAPGGFSVRTDRTGRRDRGGGVSEVATLDWSDCELTDELLEQRVGNELPDLLARLRPEEGCTAECAVNLAGNELRGRRPLGALLQNFRDAEVRVTCLRLHRNHLKDEALDALIEHIGASSSQPLAEIHLSDNHLTEVGIQSLIQAAFRGHDGRRGRALWLRAENQRPPLSNPRGVLDSLAAEGMSVCLLPSKEFQVPGKGRPEVPVHLHHAFVPKTDQRWNAGLWMQGKGQGNPEGQGNYSASSSAGGKMSSRGEWMRGQERGSKDRGGYKGQQALGQQQRWPSLSQPSSSQHHGSKGGGGGGGHERAKGKESRRPDVPREQREASRPWPQHHSGPAGASAAAHPPQPPPPPREQRSEAQTSRLKEISGASTVLTNASGSPAWEEWDESSNVEDWEENRQNAWEEWPPPPEAPPHEEEDIRQQEEAPQPSQSSQTGSWDECVQLTGQQQWQNSCDWEQQQQQQQPIEAYPAAGYQPCTWLAQPGVSPLPNGPSLPSGHPGHGAVNSHPSCPSNSGSAWLLRAAESVRSKINECKRLGMLRRSLNPGETTDGEWMRIAHLGAHHLVQQCTQRASVVVGSFVEEDGMQEVIFACAGEGALAAAFRQLRLSRLITSTHVHNEQDDNQCASLVSAIFGELLDVPQRGESEHRWTARKMAEWALLDAVFILGSARLVGAGASQLQPYAPSYPQPCY